LAQLVNVNFAFVDFEHVVPFGWVAGLGARPDWFLVRYKTMVFGIELMRQVLFLDHGQDCFCVASGAGALDCGQRAACDVDRAGVAGSDPIERFIQFAGVCFVHLVAPLLLKTVV
jgi:hypothetical protein